MGREDVVAVLIHRVTDSRKHEVDSFRKCPDEAGGAVTQAGWHDVPCQQGPDDLMTGDGL